MTTLALAPIAVRLPPKSAPSASAHHSTFGSARLVHARGQLADDRRHRRRERDVVDHAGHRRGDTQDQHRRDQAVPAGDLGGRPGQLFDDARLHQSAHHDEQPGEEQQRLPLDTGQIVALLEPGDQDQDASADQRDYRRRDVQHRVPDEGGEHSRQDQPALDQQGRILNRLTLFQRHHIGDTGGVDVERPAEHEWQHHDERHHDDDHDGGHVNQEVVE